MCMMYKRLVARYGKTVMLKETPLCSGFVTQDKRSHFWKIVSFANDFKKRDKLQGLYKLPTNRDHVKVPKYKCWCPNNVTSHEEKRNQKGNQITCIFMPVIKASVYPTLFRGRGCMRGHKNNFIIKSCKADAVGEGTKAGPWICRLLLLPSELSSLTPFVHIAYIWWLHHFRW